MQSILRGKGSLAIGNSVADGRTGVRGEPANWKAYNNSSRKACVDVCALNGLLRKKALSILSEVKPHQVLVFPLLAELTRLVPQPEPHVRGCNNQRGWEPLMQLWNADGRRAPIPQPDHSKFPLLPADFKKVRNGIVSVREKENETEDIPSASLTCPGLPESWVSRCLLTRRDRRAFLAFPSGGDFFSPFLAHATQLPPAVFLSCFWFEFASRDRSRRRPRRKRLSHGPGNYRFS